MEIQVTGDRPAKVNELYHFVFTASWFIPNITLKYLAKRTIDTKGKGTIGQIEKIYSQNNEIHIFVRVLKNPLPVAVIVYALGSIGILAALGIVLKQTYLVVAEGIPNTVVYLTLGLGIFFILFKTKLLKGKT